MFDVEKNGFYKATELSSEVEKGNNITFSGNGSLKYSTSGNPFVDDFMMIASYRNPRPIKEVFETMKMLWSIDPITTLKESVYLRLITRDTKLFEGTKLKVQKGQGLRAEFFSRMMWLAVYHPNTFKKNLPLTLMALPALIVMFLFRYLPMSGLLLAFKRFSVRKGIFGSDWVGLNNFQFLFQTSDAWVITRNTICYNVLFILMDLILAVAMAIGLSELLRKRRAKIYQTIFMAPYFLSWVVVSFMAFSLFSVDDGLFNHLLAYFGFQGVDWYSEPGKWPFILTFFQIWKTIGYSTVMYISSLTGISNDYYEAAIIDGATKWQQIKRITLPCLKPMMIVLTILAIGRIFYADFGLFFQLPRNSGPLYPATQVIDTYVYRALKETGNVGMAAAASLYQSIVGFVMVVGANLVVRRIEPDSALF